MARQDMFDTKRHNLMSPISVAL